MSNATREAIEMLGTEPSLKAIAAALEVPAQRIYSVAKQPKAGEVYDARVYNWDAIDRFITRRLSPDGLETAEAVIQKAIELDVEFQAADGRKGPRGVAKSGILMGDGTMMPARKINIEVGDKVMLKKEVLPTVYEVMMTTETHAVLQAEGTSTLTGYSNWTLNQKLIGPDLVEGVKAQREAAIAEAAEANQE